MKLDRRSKIPFYHQIYDRFRDAIAAGQLAPGDRLPSARSLASQLGTARGTIDVAYNMLAGEGYIVGQGAAGTVVAPGIVTSGIATSGIAVAAVQATDSREGKYRQPRSVRQRAAKTAPARSDPDTSRQEHDGEPVGRGNQGEPRLFQMGIPAFDAFPRKLWTRLAARRARTLTTAMMGYPDPQGDPGLRDAIAAYLAIARGIRCHAGQIIITGGYQGALGLITRTLLQPGDAVWLEDPGYFLSRLAFQAAKAKIVPVPVDDEGLDVDAGLRRQASARFAVVTPSHQSPLGVSLSLHRRLALLDWAQQRDAWVIEDDYDSEYRYVGRPLPALKSLDQEDRVLYVGTFSKVLLPALRLGYLVVPESLTRQFDETCRLLHPNQNAFGETVIADFMAQGHFARHIRRMRQLYAERRSALAEALTEQLGDRFQLHLAAGGLHLLMRPRKRESDRLLVQRAQAHGLAPTSLSTFRLERDCGSGLLLNFTNIPAENAPKAASLLARALRDE